MNSVFVLFYLQSQTNKNCDKSDIKQKKKLTDKAKARQQIRFHNKSTHLKSLI